MYWICRHLVNSWYGLSLVRSSFAGSLSALLVGNALFLLSTLGKGLLISSYSHTQQQAVLWAFFLIMPTIVVFSGFAFPVQNIPESVQWLACGNPLFYYLTVIRDVFLKGGGLTDHGVEYSVIDLLGKGALALSIVRLR